MHIFFIINVAVWQKKMSQVILRGFSATHNLAHAALPRADQLQEDLWTNQRLHSWIRHNDWNEEEVLRQVGPQLAQHVLEVPISSVCQDDELKWPFSRDGRVAVKSAYHRIRERTSRREATTNTMEPYHHIWRAKVSQKIKVFMWRLISNVLPVWECLARRGVPISSRCLGCEEVESVDHLLTGCSWTHPVWLATCGFRTADDRAQVSE